MLYDNNKYKLQHRKQLSKLQPLPKMLAKVEVEIVTTPQAVIYVATEKEIVDQIFTDVTTPQAVIQVATFFHNGVLRLEGYNTASSNPSCNRLLLRKLLRKVNLLQHRKQ